MEKLRLHILLSPPIIDKTYKSLRHHQRISLFKFQSSTSRKENTAPNRINNISSTGSAREIIMAEECTDSSVGTSSSTPPNWWPDLHGNSLSSWNNLWHNQNPNSNSSCEEDVSISTSFTNASNHSGLTVESSRRLVETSSSNELIVEHASENNLWSHVLL